ncbi:hypothetical protein EYF80_045688 [Liparis tanakae]|uniref:Uncharacterized protein n=1 Tax=Liparis tanakae TaxID=230148 RepID=A0A4Z2FSW8_9TELE|nr:hypothetical protein EYF80_045688 [Liparis tanakae]
MEKDVATSSPGDLKERGGNAVLQSPGLPYVGARPRALAGAGDRSQARPASAAALRPSSLSPRPPLHWML